MRQPIRAFGIQRGGFTLLELLVVLAIGGILLASVSTDFAAFLPGQQLRKAAYDFSNGLRMARDRALENGTNQGLAVNVVSNTYQILGDTAIRRLPPHCRFEVARPLGNNHAPGVVFIGFFPDGSSTGVDISITNGHQRHRLHVDWLTGNVSLDEA